MDSSDLQMAHEIAKAEVGMHARLGVAFTESGAMLTDAVLSADGDQRLVAAEVTPASEAR